MPDFSQWATQREIAETLEVDRRTVHEWHHRGLEFKPGKRGTNRYFWPAVISFYGGVGFAADHKLPRNDAPFLSCLIHSSFNELDKTAEMLAEGYGMTELEAERLIGEAIGTWRVLTGRFPPPVRGR